MWLSLIKRYWPLWVLATIFVHFYTPQTQAQNDPIILDAATRRMTIDRGIEYLVEEQPLDHFQASGESSRLQWKMLNSKTINFGLLTKPTWFRFDLVWFLKKKEPRERRSTIPCKRRFTVVVM